MNETRYSTRIMPADARLAWDLLRRTGFVGQWAAEALKDDIEHLYLRHWSDVGVDSGRLVVIQDADGPYGTLAASAYGPGTWLMHQMGMLPGTYDTLLRPDTGRILGHMARGICGMRGAERLIVHAENRGLNRRLYTEFVKYINDASVTSITYSPVYRRSAAKPFPASASPPSPFIPAEFHEGDEGANIFGFMNMCRMPKGRDGAREGRLRWISEHYLALGKRSFVLLDSEGDGVPERLGYEYVSEGLCWTLQADAYGMWIEHLRSLSETKREKK